MMEEMITGLYILCQLIKGYTVPSWPDPASNLSLSANQWPGLVNTNILLPVIT